MYSSRFVHLRTHSFYSIVDGLCSPSQIVKVARENNMISVGMNDFFNFHGIIKFYQSAWEKGIKPIIGVDLQVSFDDFSLNTKSSLTDITLLALNKIGYNNIISLISLSHKTVRSNCTYLSIIPKWLITYNEGILVLSGGCNGYIGKNLLLGRLDLVNLCVDFFKKYFANNFYLEISRVGELNEEEYIKRVIDLSVVKKIAIVATNKVLFLKKEDFYFHKIRVCINSKNTIHDKTIKYNFTSLQFMRSQKEMCSIFSDIPESLENSVEISKRCNVYLSFKKKFLPRFSTLNIESNCFLVEKSNIGLHKRLLSLKKKKGINKNLVKKYKLRLNEELAVINKMGFASYFLVVMEFIQWAKDNNIPVGPGRGSGAGSLVAYALKITEIDPLEFNLLFERFLNVERVSMPDFDIDFCMNKRDRVIEHLVDIYGIDAVAQITTFGTLTAKAVVRDVGRVLGYPYGFINRVSKLIPLDFKITIEKSLVFGTDLFDLYNKDENVKKLIDISKKLEGVIRNVSKHAGGVVISPTKITDFSPLYYDEKSKQPITQFDKNDIEKVGLVKFDFLGLRTLTIINKTVVAINKNRAKNKKSFICLYQISLFDKKCFKFLRSSFTTGIFQLESKGMQELIRKIKPSSFEDIVALLALFRPGPLQSGMVDNFINRKNKREPISYPDKEWQDISLKPILESTYGIILYQEQVMMIAQVLANYTLGEADILRRAMTKKDILEMSQQRSNFEERAKTNYIEKKLAHKIFDLLEKFAGYGFNRSHSVAYAMISYQTLWLKTYYASYYISASINADIVNTKKVFTLVQEAKRMKIKVLPPCINNSKYGFYAFSKNKIIYGIGAIKGVGKISIKTILLERKKSGKFLSLFDLCSRTDLAKVNKRILEKLIMSGSLDSLNKNRVFLLENLKKSIKSALQYKKTIFLKQRDLFNYSFNEFKKNKESDIFSFEWNKNTKLNFEYEAFGFYLTGHPIDQYKKELNFYTNNSSLKFINSFGKIFKGITYGMITFVKRKTTKNNKNIIFLEITDNEYKLDVICFEKTIRKYKNLLFKNNILIIKGTTFFDNYKNCMKLVAQKIFDINFFRRKYIKKIYLFLRHSQLNSNFLKILKNCLEEHVCNVVPIFISYKILNVNINFSLGEKWFVDPNCNLIHKLESLVGEKNIILKFKKK